MHCASSTPHWRAIPLHLGATLLAAALQVPLVGELVEVAVEVAAVQKEEAVATEAAEEAVAGAQG